MKEFVEKVFDVDIGTVKFAVGDVQKERILKPSPSFDVAEADGVLRVTAIEEVHEDIADAIWLRRCARI